MAAWNIFGKKQKRKFYIICDVGSRSIRSLLIEKSPDGAVGFKKQLHLLSRRELGRHRIKHIGTRLHEIIFHYIRGLGKIPDKVLIGLSSDMVFNELAGAEKKRKNKSKPIDAREITEFINESIAERKERQVGEDNFILVGAEPVRLAVDGYDVNFDRMRVLEGGAIKINIALSYVNAELWRELKKFRHLWGGLDVNISPMQIEVARTLIRENAANDFFIIKIGERSSELSAVNNRTLNRVATLVIGGDDATEEIAKELGVSASHAEEIKRQFGAIVLPPDVAGKAGKIFKAWIQRLVGLVKELVEKEDLVLPPKIYLYGGGARLAALKNELEADERLRGLTFSEKLDVRLLDAGDIVGENLKNVILRGPEEVGLAALALGLVKEDNE